MKEKVESNRDDTENKNSACGGTGRGGGGAQSTSVTEKILWGATCDEILVPRGGRN